MKQKTSIATILFIWLFTIVVWGLYRYFFHLPEWFEELVLKPIIFVGPVIFYLYQRKEFSAKSLGLIFPESKRFLIWGGAFGLFLIVESVATWYLKGNRFNPANFNFSFIILNTIISFGTAFFEEILYRGFILERLFAYYNEYVAILFAAILFMFGHVGQGVFILHYSVHQLLFYLISMLVLGYANGFIYRQTRSVFASTFFHGLWNLSITLLT